MFSLVTWFYRSNLITGAYNVFINDLDLLLRITLESLLQTKPSSHRDGQSCPGSVEGKTGLAWPFPHCPHPPLASSISGILSGPCGVLLDNVKVNSGRIRRKRGVHLQVMAN